MANLLYRLIVEPARDPDALQRNCWYVSLALVTWAAWGMWDDGGMWPTVVAIVLVSWGVTWILMLLYALILPVPAFLLEQWVEDSRSQNTAHSNQSAPNDYQPIKNLYHRYE